MWSHRGRFVQYSTSEQRAHGFVMRFCSWGLSFWCSSWAWEAFAGRSLQRTRKLAFAGIVSDPEAVA